MKHSTEMNITHIKKQFPIFKNNELIYLDSAASAQKPLCVIEAIKNLYSNNVFLKCSKMCNKYFFSQFISKRFSLR